MHGNMPRRESNNARRFRHRGMALMWMAMLIVVFIAMVALAIDWGYAYWTSQKLQNAADAAALAGARQVYYSHDDARSQAVAIAGANEAGGKFIELDENAANDSDGDVVIGYYDVETREFTAIDDSTANAVAVNARLTEESANGPLDLIWGTIIGTDTAQITRWAIGVVDGGPAGNSIIALDADDPSSFYMHGTPTLDMGSGNVQVNSSNGQGVRMSGTANLIGENVNMVGGYRWDGYTAPDGLDFNRGRPSVSDPLAGVPEPNRNAMTKFNKITSSGTYNPGYFPGGFADKPGTNIFLNPGVYVFDNGFQVKGTVTGYKVMIFIRTGAFDHTSNNVVTLTPPPIDDDPLTFYDGIQFFQSRTNTSPAKLVGGGTVTGLSSAQGAGTMYFPAALFEMGGNNSQFYINSLIANKVEVRGTGDIYITRGYETTSAGDKVYLAE